MKFNTTFILIAFILFTLSLTGCKDNSTSTESQSSNMTLISTFKTSDYASGVSVGKIGTNTFAFVADGVSGLEIINVTVPVHPILASNYNTTGTSLNTFFAHINNIPFVLVADGNQGCDIINVSDPYNPVLDTILTFQGDRVLSSFVDTTSKIAYIGTFIGNLYIYNLGNLPNSVSQLSVYTNLVDHIQGIRVVNGLAYIADASVGMDMVNVTNPSAPVEINGYNTPGYTNDVLVTMNRAYLADGGDGIFVIDVTNPFQIRLVGSVQTQGVSYNGLASNGAILYSASADYGVEAFSIGTPNSPLRAGYYKTPSTVINVCYYEGYIYAAVSYTGLLILTLQ